MSDDKSKPASPAATQTPPAPAATAAHPPAAGALPDLMASGDKGTAKPAEKSAKPNLEAEALRAAEQALADGERALAAARATLHAEPAPVRAGSQKREIALRALLAVNVLAMVVVALLPSPNERGTNPVAPVAAPHGAEHATDAGHADPASGHGTPHAVTPKFDERYTQALVKAESGEFAAAIALLEQYLDENPRMQPGTKANVLNTLAYYASRAGDWKRSADFQRQFETLKGSHSLPEDLVQEAKAALEAGDQEKLRRTWARFLLQQKQIPTWLYKHVAEAYLQLGDSYRKEAEVAAAAQRQRELEAAEAQLREAAIRTQERGK